MNTATSDLVEIHDGFILPASRAYAVEVFDAATLEPVAVEINDGFVLHAPRVATTTALEA